MSINSFTNNNSNNDNLGRDDRPVAAGHAGAADPQPRGPGDDVCMHVCMYTCMCDYMYMNIYVYIYIYRAREIDIDRYIYIYTW